MSTHRQIEANRKNALLSTGPKTEEGKAASRANSLKHGRSGAGVVATAEEREELQERLEIWRPSFQKELQDAGPDRELVFEQLVLNSIRIQAAHRREAEIHVAEHERAVQFWDDDRALKAENLGKGLAKSKRPALTVAKLRTFLHGLQWLIAQWLSLKTAIETGEPLSEADTALFQALRGITPDSRLRTLFPDRTAARAIVDETLERLQGKALEGAEAMDDWERTAAEERGFLVEISREERLNRRYEDLAHKRYDEAQKQLKSAPVKFSNAVAPLPVPRPQPTPLPLPSQPPSSKVASLEAILQEKPVSISWPLRNEAVGTLGKAASTLTASPIRGNAGQVRIVPARS